MDRHTDTDSPTRKHSHNPSILGIKGYTKGNGDSTDLECKNNWAHGITVPWFFYQWDSKTCGLLFSLKRVELWWPMFYKKCENSPHLISYALLCIAKKNFCKGQGQTEQ